MYRKFHWLLCSFMAAGTALFAQSSDITNMKASFAPASPEAAALFKFQDIPVSKYTGTADITIPLVTAAGKNNSWPVNLRYHTSGIKVREVAGYTGLGWQLNASGMVSRKVRGLPDDRPTGYLNFNDWYNVIYMRLTNFSTYTETFTTAADLMINGLRDGEPDEYYFSFNGYSGKMMFKQGAFLFGQRPELLVSCHVPMKVSYLQSGSSITSWIFIAPDGLQYTFDVRETTKTRTDPPDLCNVASIREEYTSSWYLSSIISVNGFNATNMLFTYDDYFIDYEWQTSETETHSNATAHGCYGPIPGPTPALTFSRSLMTLRGKKIRKIYLADTKTTVDFIYNNPRLDLNATSNNNSLDEIVVSRDASGSLQPVEKTKLTYFYQGNRLMLQSVQRMGTDGITAIPPYVFTYDNGILPDRIQGAKLIDHWGYAGGNNRFLPKYEELNYPGWNYYPVAQGSDRNARLQTTRAQSLTKVSYPTGGTTQLDYELNMYGFIQNNSLHDLDIFHYTDTSVEQAVQGDTNRTGYVYSERRLYVAPGADKLTFVAEASLAPCFYEPGPDGEPLPGGGVFCPDRNFPQASLYYESPTGELSHVSTFQSSRAYTWHSYILPDAQPGYYVIKVQAASHITPYGRGIGSIGASLVWKKRGERVTQKNSGGLRIRSITDYDSIGVIAKVRQYDYTAIYNGMSQSTGVIYKEPKYLYTGFPVVAITDPNTGAGSYAYCTRQTITGVSSIQTEETSGSHIGYRQVTEWLLYKGRPNGKTVTHYTSPFTHPDVINDEKPFGIPLTQQYKTGLLQKQLIYDSAGAMLKEDTYDHVFFEHEAPSVKISKGVLECPCPGAGDINTPCGTPTLGFDIDGNGLNDMFARNMNSARIGFSQLQKEVHKQDGFIVQKIYTYDNNLQLVKKIVVKDQDTDADSVVMTYKHPGDEAGMPGLSPDELDAIAQMKQVGMSTHVLEENKQRQNTGIIRIRNHYRNFDQNAHTKTALSGISIQNGAGALEKKYDIEAYDLSGKITQQRRTSDIPYSYVWDELTGNPIAEVINAAVGNIAFTSFENTSAQSGGWIVGPGDSYPKTAGGLTGRYAYALQNGPITKNGLEAGKKYIVSYWSKNGAYNVNSTTALTGRTNGLGWTYYEHLTNNTTSSIVVSGSGLIDELRLYPQEAEMTSYTYEPGTGMLSRNTVSNVLTFYEYDALNRLKAERDQDGNILLLNEYRYQVQERNMQADWRDVTPAVTRCETGMDRNENNNYHTGNLLKKQTDANPYSNTYNQVRWVFIARDTTACPVQPSWQYYGYECVNDACGNRTGAYRNIERDNNPYSSTYLQTRVVNTGGTNTGICPLPPACYGEGMGPVNNVCTLGQKVIISSEESDCYRTEVYYYQWSCGTRSSNYTKTTRIPNCTVQ